MVSNSVYHLSKLRKVFTMAIKDEMKEAKRQILITMTSRKKGKCPSCQAINYARLDIILGRKAVSDWHQVVTRVVHLTPNRYCLLGMDHFPFSQIASLYCR